jgi:hypothetical protein
VIVVHADEERTTEGPEAPAVDEPILFAMADAIAIMGPSIVTGGARTEFQEMFSTVMGGLARIEDGTSDKKKEWTVNGKRRGAARIAAVLVKHGVAPGDVSDAKLKALYSTIEGTTA